MILGSRYRYVYFAVFCPKEGAFLLGNLFEPFCPNDRVWDKSSVRKQGIPESVMSEQQGLSKTPTVRRQRAEETILVELIYE